MSSLRPLRGACQCGRNRYLIVVPEDSIDAAQVLFNTDSAHQVSLATPLPAYIRVPLSWYSSATYAYCDDERHSTIRRSYTHPDRQDCKRYFCGYCGTQLSYWSESPATEAEYIHLTLGSLLHEDLHDLEELGLIPDDTDSDEQTAEDVDAGHAVDDKQKEPAEPTIKTLRPSFGVPWFEDLVQDTKLGRLRRKHGGGHSKDGRLQVEWEIIEYTDNGNNDIEDVDMQTASAGKRKLDEREDAEI